MNNHNIFPTEVVLEVTNICNLKCRHCHFHSAQAKKRRDLGFMPSWVWKRVLDEIKTWPVSVSLITHGAGEPLIYPNLQDILEKAKKISHVRVGFMTNGMLLDHDWSTWLVQNQVDFIFFSIDGVDPATHDYFRINADLKKIEHNVMTLVKEKEKQGSSLPRLSFNMVGYPEILAQAEPYARKWLPVAESISIARFRPIGSRKLWAGDNDMPFRPCPLLWKQMVISFDGRVGLCCEDINLDVPLGELKDLSLFEIYNGRLISEYRKKHLKGKISNLPLCSGCHAWAGELQLEEQSLNWGNLDVTRLKTPSSVMYRKG